MTPKSDLRTEAARLMAFFEAAGALQVDADILQPAELLLDLYGEDIRGRAFVTSDPLRGELMLRPDFTVPVVQMHMAGGAKSARYTYAGEVFRKQEENIERASEYFQVGFELFDRENPALADAEVFALFDEVLSPLGLRAVTGDIGILTAAVNGLSTTDRRKQALLRHLWRPHRFRALLDRFGGRTLMANPRAKLLELLESDGPESVMAAGGEPVGLRSAGEIADRLDVIQSDAKEPPIGAGEVELFDMIISIKETAPNALQHLRDIAVDLPAIQPAVQRMAERLDALNTRGIDVDGLEFEGGHGRTTLEYYDGFVFGFTQTSRPDLPPVATGGRYDALTKVLGQGDHIPAIGGVIRPELLRLIMGAEK